MRQLYLLYVLFFFSLNVFAQQDTTLIDEVRLIGLRNSLERDSTTSIIHQISKREIQRSEDVILTPILNRVPGVYMQQGAINTNRITIRGIGARSQFSTNRLNAYVGEIPISDANGETILEDIDVEVLSGISVIKGTNQSVYGSNMGGVVLLQPTFGDAESQLSYTSILGSFGLQKNSLKYKTSDENKQLFVSYHDLQQDGFRENNNYDRKSFNLFGRIKASEKTSLELLAIYTKLKAFIPSSLSLDDFQNNPSQAAFIWRQSQGFESYDRLILGATLTHELTPSAKLKSSIFTNFKDAYEPRPFDILGENQMMIGTRNLLSYQPEIFKKKLTLRGGVEFKHEWYANQTSQNLYQDFPGQGSVRGELLTSFQQQRSFFVAFADANYTISDKLRAELGLSMQQTKYSVEDLFLNDGEDLSGNFQYPQSINPRFGLSYDLTKNTSLHSSISSGFSVPTFAESLLPDGRLNDSLQPESAWNYELSFRSSLWNNQLYLEANAYRMNVSNLLVAQRIAEDQFVGRNAGSTRHDGIELLVNSHINLSKQLVLKPYFSTSFNFFEFVEFVDDDNDFSGNQLTGIPDQQLNLGLDIVYKNFTLYSNWMYVGEIPLNDFNSIYSDAYQLINLKLVYSKQFFKHWEFSANAGINNLLDEKYAASILPNAVGFGGAQPRYFYPGLPRNYFVGVGVNYLF